MGSLSTLIRRELGVYFVSPMAYIVMTAYLFITGYFFAVNLEGFARNHLPVSYEGAVGIIWSMTIFMTPLITMRLLAEEKNKGTIEILMTAPLTEFQVVLSKYLASMLFYVLLLVPSVLFIVLLAFHTTLDLGEVIGGYVSLLMLASALFAIGLFISSLCSNQISAGIITLIISILFLVTNELADSIRDPSWVKEVLNYISFPRHIFLLMKGIIDSRDIVLMLSVVGLFLFLTVRVVESRRWR